MRSLASKPELEGVLAVDAGEANENPVGLGPKVKPDDGVDGVPVVVVPGAVDGVEKSPGPADGVEKSPAPADGVEKSPAPDDGAVVVDGVVAVAPEAVVSPPKINPVGLGVVVLTENPAGFWSAVESFLKTNPVAGGVEVTGAPNLNPPVTGAVVVGAVKVKPPVVGIDALVDAAPNLNPVPDNRYEEDTKLKTSNYIKGKIIV